MKKLDEDAITLTKESKYVIKSLESKEKPLVTSGIFKGYTSIGSDEGICIEMDKTHGDLAGKIRVIPVGVLVCIDLIEAAREEEEDTDATARYFG